MKCIKSKSIYVPSTFRLLRLVNGIKCESGAECGSYNLEQQEPAHLNKSSLRPFGMMLCPSCVECISVQASYRSSWFARVDHICSFQSTKLLSNTQKDLTTGEKVGSIILAKHVKQIENTYFTTEKRQKAAHEIFTQLWNQNTTQEGKDQGPVMQLAFDVAMSQYEAFAQSVRDIATARKQRREAQRASRKLELARPVFQKITEGLGSFQHQEIVLECRWNQHGYCRFNHRLSSDILGPLLSAPSSTTQTKITEAVQRVREAYRLLYAKIGRCYPLQLCKFLDETPDLLESSRALLKFFITKISWSEVINLANERFISLVDTGDVVAGLLGLLSFQEKREVFVRGVVADSPTSKKKKLAYQVFIHLVNDSLNTPLSFSHCYLQCKAEYERLLQNLNVYLEQHETVAFLAETTFPPRFPQQTFTRQDAIDTIYDGMGYDLLESNNFDGLRQEHRRIFGNPRLFDLPLNP